MYVLTYLFTYSLTQSLLSGITGQILQEKQEISFSLRRVERALDESREDS